jgi:amidase
MPLAPSFDTVGWFAKTPELMDRAAAAFGLAAPDDTPKHLVLPVDAWALAGAATVDALGAELARLEAKYGPAKPVVLAPEGLSEWFEAFRVCQAAEVWQAHKDWVGAVDPTFGPGIADRFKMAAGISAENWETARAARDAACTRMAEIFQPGTLMVLPTSPGPAPLRTTDNARLDDFRTRALHLLCPAGLAGYPQLSVPAGHVDGAPVGLGLVGGAYADRMLIAAALG